jgi:hypothetical protein
VGEYILVFKQFIGSDQLRYASFKRMKHCAPVDNYAVTIIISEMSVLLILSYLLTYPICGEFWKQINNFIYKLVPPNKLRCLS